MTDVYLTGKSCTFACVNGGGGGEGGQKMERIEVHAPICPITRNAAKKLHKRVKMWILNIPFLIILCQFSHIIRGLISVAQLVLNLSSEGQFLYF